MNILVLIPIYDITNAIEIIKNIIKYTNNAYIILHNNLNTHFTNEQLLENIQSEIPNDNKIFINPERLKMDNVHQQSPNSLWEILISNLHYSFEISDKISNWSYAIAMASNERFVRYGVERFLENSEKEAGYSTIPLGGFSEGNTKITHDKQLHWGETAEVWKYIIPYLDDFYYGQVDGAFLSRNMCKFLCNLPTVNYHNLDVTASIEKLLPSFIHKYTNKIGKSITYMDWINNLKITPEIIDNIRSSDNYRGIYSVKRVNMDDIELRQYINNLDF